MLKHLRTGIISLFLMISLLTGQLRAQVAFDAATNLGDNGGSGALTHSHVMGTGAHGLLLVWFLGDFSTDNITSVTYGGQTMTLCKKNLLPQAGAAGRALYCYKLVSPPTGTNNVVITPGLAKYVIGLAVSYTGAGDADNASAASNWATGVTSLATSLTTPAANCWWAGCAGDDGSTAPNAGSGATFRVLGSFSAISAFDSNGIAAAASGTSVTFNATGASSGISATAVAIKPYSANATAFTLSGPSTGPVSAASSAFTVAPNSGSLAVAETVTLSDGGAGGTFTPATLSFAMGATAGQTFTYTPASAGTVTITATASPALGTAPTASYTAVTTSSVTNSNLYWSPGNWWGDGTGSLLSTNIKAGSSYALASQYSGAYVKLGISGTALTVYYDLSNNLDALPSLIVYVDNASPVTYTPASTSETSHTFTLSAGNHAVLIFSQQNAYAHGYEAQNGFKITGFGGTLISIPASWISLQADKAVFFGDSITQGTGSADALRAYVSTAAMALGAEFGNCGIGSTGYSVTFQTYPAANGQITSHSSGHTRPTDSTVKWVFLTWGTNDSGLSASTIQTVITTARSQYSAAYIVLVKPISASSGLSTTQATIATATANYLTANPSDTKVAAISLPTAFESWFGSSSYQSLDLLHPNGVTHPIMGAAIAAQAQKAFATGGTTVIVKRRVQ